MNNNQNVFETLYISKDPQASIIIEDLTQQLKLAEQKNEYFQTENKRLNGKLQQYQQKYKSSQTKKKQLNTIQSELQDLYKGNMGTLEVMLTETQRENADLTLKLNESKAQIKVCMQKIKDYGDQVEMYIGRVAGMTSENEQLNHVIAQLTGDRMKLEIQVKELNAVGQLKDLQLAQREKDYEELESQNDSLETQNEDLKAKIVQLNSSIEMLMLEGKQLKDIIQDKDLKFNTKTSTLEELSKEFDMFRTNKGREVSDLQGQISKLEVQLAELNKKYEDQCDTIEDLNEKIADMQKESVDIHLQLKLLKEKNDRLFQQNSTLTMKVTELEGQLDAYDRQSERSFTSGSSASHTNEQMQSLEFLLENERSRMQQIRDTHLAAISRLSNSNGTEDTHEDDDV